MTLRCYVVLNKHWMNIYDFTTTAKLTYYKPISALVPKG
ncbi:hypothetical protein EMUCRT_0561 [Ehrlichia cf. muris str. EmCRT]|uniref:Uncharacterized protein n=1 Tax=Ehrlichia cf. muris str. EmCRT TaxID=1359167 RepID=A0A0F3ND02_9RICK|nr:hypothetical protein EMUCRT_0561 [Ehrlichia cf. muris str. EmCRT]